MTIPTDVFWQEGDDEMTEEAVSLQSFRNCIALEQNGHQINLNYKSLDKFIKALRIASRNRVL